MYLKSAAAGVLLLGSVATISLAPQEKQVYSRCPDSTFTGKHMDIRQYVENGWCTQEVTDRMSGENYTMKFLRYSDVSDIGMLVIESRISKEVFLARDRKTDKPKDLEYRKIGRIYDEIYH